MLFRSNEVRIKIARIFNTFGPRMRPDDGRVISNFIVQALQGKDITIYGDGSQTRSFIYVDDLVDGLIKLMNSDDSITGPINLGNPNEHSIIQLANTIIRLTESSSKLSFHSKPVDDPLQRKPSIDLAKELLNGWGPSELLEDGLMRTIDYFKNELSLK